MKFEFKERESREFYDEILFIAAHYNKLINYRNKRINKLSNYMIKNIIISIILLVLVGYYYLKTKSKFEFAMIIMLVALLLYSIYYLFVIRRRINEFVNHKGKETITINGKLIEFKDENNSFKVDWDQIAFILISKYSICFIPKTRQSAMITFGVQNKDKLIKALNKYNKENLLVDNSSRYR